MKTQTIKKYLSDKGMRPYHLAQAANISPSLLSRFLNGHTELNIPTIQKLARAMGIKTGTLINRLGL
jgi:transcriptional regulator with XRE-family HTH domain